MKLVMVREGVELIFRAAQKLRVGVTIICHVTQKINRVELAATWGYGV